MEGHEDLSRSDNFGHAKLDASHTPARRHNIHTVMRLKVERLRVPGIHFQPGVWREALENWHGARFRSRVPMLDGAAGIQHQRKIGIRLFRKRFPLNAEQPCFTVICRKMAVGVEPRGLHFRSICRVRPLNSTVAFKQFVGKSGIVAQTAGRNFFPFFESIAGLSPTWK